LADRGIGSRRQGTLSPRRHFHCMGMSGEEPTNGRRRLRRSAALGSRDGRRRDARRVGAVFRCAVTSLAVALAAAFFGFSRFMPLVASSLAETVYQVATAVFVISALCVVFVTDEIVTGRRAAIRQRAARRVSSGGA
jgi:hypothetical protein